jgi:hypothetical protein
MKNWKLGFVIVAGAVLMGAGAGGRAALWANPEGDSLGAPQTVPVALAELKPSADADADNGPGCAESALTR